MLKASYAVTKIKQSTQAIAPAIGREVSNTTATQAPEAGQSATSTSDVFKRLRPIADRMMTSAGQSFGGNMAAVCRELTLSPAERAESFRTRHQTSLAGRTGLVTGAAGNIGSETAFMMAQNKMNIMLTDMPHTNLDNVAKTCELLGAGNVVVSKHDLTEEAGRAALIAKTLSDVGSPYAMAFCAGIYVEGGLWHADPEVRSAKMRRFELANKVNVEAPVALAEAFVPYLNPGSHVLVVNSLAGVTPVKGEPLYCGTKYALDGIWSTMAKDFGDTGIKFEQVFPSALLGKMAEGRLGLEPELLHYPLAVVRAMEAAFKTEGNSYVPRIDVSGAISPYVADHA